MGPITGHYGDSDEIYLIDAKKAKDVMDKMSYTLDMIMNTGDCTTRIINADELVQTFMEKFHMGDYESLIGLAKAVQGVYTPPEVPGRLYENPESEPE
jgi:hypothetical protein